MAFKSLTTSTVLRMVLGEDDEDNCNEVFFDGSDEDFGLIEEVYSDKDSDEEGNYSMETEHNSGRVLNNAESDYDNDQAVHVNDIEIDGDYDGDEEAETDVDETGNEIEMHTTTALNESQESNNSNGHGTSSELEESDYSDEVESNDDDDAVQNSTGNRRPIMQ